MKRSPSTVPSESSVDRISSALRMRSKSPLRSLRLVRLFAVIVTTPPGRYRGMKQRERWLTSGPRFVVLQLCPREFSRKRANRMRLCPNPSTPRPSTRSVQPTSATPNLWENQCFGRDDERSEFAPDTSSSRQSRVHCSADL